MLFVLGVGCNIFRLNLACLQNLVSVTPLMLHTIQCDLNAVKCLDLPLPEDGNGFLSTVA